MKRNTLSFLPTGVALVLVMGLVTTGCSKNRAQDAEEPVTEEVAAISEREAALDAREQELERRVREVEEMLDEIETAEAVEAVEPPAAVEPVEPARPRPVLVEVPQDTELAFTLLDPLSSETSRVGDPINAAIEEDVVSGGRVAFPAGSEVLGTVVEVVPQKKIGGQARVSVLFDEIVTPTGYRAAIEGSFTAEGKSQKKKDAATIGGSAAGGALLGRILSDKKGKGTVIGGIIGAAAGAVAARQNRADPVAIEPGTVILVRLALPVHVALTFGDGAFTIAAAR